MNKKLVYILTIIVLLSSILTCKGDFTEDNPTQTNSLVYKDEAMGFTLDFPISWKEYYIVNKTSEDCIEVCFIGKSNASKSIYDSDTNGLPLFYIATEDYVTNGFVTDRIMVIGVFGNMKYYYFTSTDYPIGMLYDVYNDIDIDKEARELAYADFLKARQMENEIQGVLKTFRVIY